MSRPAKVCCSSPTSICFWFAVSIIAWGLLSLVGIYWRPLGPSAASTIVLASGIGCVANWSRNRTFHCGISAPLLLAAGLIFLLTDIGVLHIEPGFVWPFLLLGVVIAFLLEWKYASRSTNP